MFETKTALADISREVVAVGYRSKNIHTQYTIFPRIGHKLTNRDNRVCWSIIGFCGTYCKNVLLYDIYNLKQQCVII